MTDCFRSDPANHVHVELDRADGSRLATYDAAVVRRSHENDLLHWHVMVADSVIFHVQLRVEGERVVPQSIDKTLTGEDRRTLLAANTFLLEMYQAQTLTFRVQDRVFASCMLEFLPPDALLPLRANIEMLEDVVALEELTGKVIGPFTRKLTAFERIRLRQTLLLWQGKVVQWDRALPALVSPEGVPPECVSVESTIFAVGGAEVSTPEILLGHPETTWRDQSPAPEAGPTARTLIASIPDRVRFLAWSPQTRPPSHDDRPTVGQPWGLVGVDQDAVPF